MRANLVKIQEQIFHKVDKTFFQKAQEAEAKRAQLHQVQTARRKLLYAKSLIEKIRKIEGLVAKQALLGKVLITTTTTSTSTVDRYVTDICLAHSCLGL